ncbi:hypothetical protein L1987_24809 [Smallanthus sonchifolius]|uniref:Uncharacterized protein n=1 Tax=Smallanthus sonchifolius TaxID=185202 RepID=A0ACB9IM22_9ASTR|nr:hypothetical protein L1987_24809 [Smallanthus sonchifolius]
MDSEENDATNTAQILSKSDPLLGDPSVYTITPVPPRPPTEITFFKEEPVENDSKGGGKRRKRGIDGEFYDVNDTSSSSFAPVAPQGLVPVWTMGPPEGVGMHGGAFFMIPTAVPCNGPSSAHLPQIWALPAGASGYVPAMQVVGSSTEWGEVVTKLAPISSSVSCEKKELQLMVGSSTESSSS